MELRQLRYFIAVAEEMNITRAAQRLHMTQPPLSRQLQLIEDEIGLPLFERGARPLKLTDAGRVLYAQARRVLEQADELAPLTRRLAQAAERIVIGFVPSTLYGALPEVIRAFREAAPAVELSLIEMFTLEQLGALKGGRIDIGFGRLRFDDDRLVREVLVEERLIAALPDGHPLAAPDASISLADIAGQTLIVYPSTPRPSFADQQLSALRDGGLAPAAVHEVRELQTALGLVAAQVGVSLVPESVEGVRVKGVVYRRLPEPVATSPIILSRRLHDESRATALFCSLARELMAGH
ncbi:LysR family transcriptional regulator [Burkholderia pseudomallei]|uniref:Bacterial regulatory helix-turn-helix, lysR family protein n=1 Tax=Burkholderia pseudomallei TaxID=28450 RepID=A0A2K9D455_BURPE|nr:LysR family transcriptional regulator [Burkholderia pseudomallei]AIP00643.1 bacterial regulatory helix-turn-helix, lysR family protein [Burkholderia pseudomallei]AIP55325.1 bacterial regulatory helix-turn-helix, lysR family protein [Burkholderia pseudomallei HBPUB10134a]AUG25121.1 LysR family transcriptional regulator [Burkholderia pseudomallei]EDU12345.1 cat operon transcriptional activator CatR [Burkholderia pseudomallei 1655]EMP73794.1 cat operon transcriptional activator CatR [Burkholde